MLLSNASSLSRSTTDSGAPVGAASVPAGVVVRPDPVVWHEPEMRAALALREIATVFRLLSRRLSQRAIAALTGQSQSEISEILKGRVVGQYDLLVRIAEGLGIPRGYMGLAYVHPPVDAAARTGRVPQADPNAASALRTLISAIRRSRPGSPVFVVDQWTGVQTRALRQAMRMSVR